MKTQIQNFQQKNTRESFHRHEVVSSKDERFKNLKNLPSVKICRFCGKELYTNGFYINPNWVTWFDSPENCSCKEALNYQASELLKEQLQTQEINRLEFNKNLNKKILKLFGKSGLSQRARLCTFDSYIITEANKHAHEAGRRFIENFGKDNINKYGLFIAGNIGVGKSFLAFCIANYLILKGHSVIVTTPEDLLNNIKHSYDKGNQSEFEILKIYKDVDLLILDDIGKEELTEWGLAKLNNILYYRHENFKSVILTTNYNDELLIKRISPSDDTLTASAILDRLYQTCSAIIITGKSWRVKS